mmetsp:Transcript_120620/g.303227  ORF Transcript_120620/g.303227 Transcript_120620/m.303227 type:complete len:323 (-) Transcript_120620:327-1295(-)
MLLIKIIEDWPPSPVQDLRRHPRRPRSCAPRREAAGVMVPIAAGGHVDEERGLEDICRARPRAGVARDELVDDVELARWVRLLLLDYGGLAELEFVPKCSLMQEVFRNRLLRQVFNLLLHRESSQLLLGPPQSEVVRGAHLCSAGAHLAFDLTDCCTRIRLEGLEEKVLWRTTHGEKCHHPNRICIHGKSRYASLVGFALRCYVRRAAQPSQAFRLANCCGCVEVSDLQALMRIHCNAFPPQPAVHLRRLCERKGLQTEKDLLQQTQQYLGLREGQDHGGQTMDGRVPRILRHRHRQRGVELKAPRHVHQVRCCCCAATGDA